MQNIIVAPRVGAWIEIEDGDGTARDVRSLPVWERGLKYYMLRLTTDQFGRSPCGSVD